MFFGTSSNVTSSNVRDLPSSVSLPADNEETVIGKAEVSEAVVVSSVLAGSFASSFVDVSSSEPQAANINVNAAAVKNFHFFIVTFPPNVLSSESDNRFQLTNVSVKQLYTLVNEYSETNIHSQSNS